MQTEIISYVLNNISVRHTEYFIQYDQSNQINQWKMNIIKVA